MSYWVIKKFQSPSNCGGVLDGDQKNSIAIQHIGIIFSRYEREHVICFWKVLVNDFSKNMWHALFCGNHRVGDWNFFIVVRSTIKIYFQPPLVTKVARVLIKIFMRQLQNDCITSVLTALLSTIGKPLMCKGPLMHGFIIFKFVMQKLFNI
jgi:hypothetical protein